MINNYIFQYDSIKARESVKAITKELGFVTKYDLAHIMFMAEFSHIYDFGRPIVGDRYCALLEGAVCSGVLYIASEAQKGKDAEFRHSNAGIKVSAEAKIDWDLFSKSDLEVLLKICNEVKEKNDWKSYTRSAEWGRVLNSTSIDNVITFRLMDFKNLVLELDKGNTTIWEHLCGR